jgi:hypothetical protein
MHQKSSSAGSNSLTVRDIADHTINRNNLNAGILSSLPKKLAELNLTDTNKAEISAAINTLRYATTERLKKAIGEHAEDFLMNLMHDADFAKYSPDYIQKMVREIMFLSFLSQDIARR